MARGVVEAPLLLRRWQSAPRFLTIGRGAGYASGDRWVDRNSGAGGSGLWAVYPLCTARGRSPAQRYSDLPLLTKMSCAAQAARSWELVCWFGLLSGVSFVVLLLFIQCFISNHIIK